MREGGRGGIGAQKFFNVTGWGRGFGIQFFVKIENMGFSLLIFGKGGLIFGVATVRGVSDLILVKFARVVGSFP